MNWILIALVVLLVVFLFKFKEVRHRFGLIVVIILLIFFVVSFSKIYSANDIDIGTFDGIVSAGKIYMSWLGNFAKNMGRVGGYVINQDWGLNSTNMTK